MRDAFQKEAGILDVSCLISLDGNNATHLIGLVVLRRSASPAAALMKPFSMSFSWAANGGRELGSQAGPSEGVSGPCSHWMHPKVMLPAELEDHQTRRGLRNWFFSKADERPSGFH